ncbi:hypothetical protein [Lentzea atacamensis]|nr:hypothetical protein [Lentzea atacamensis]
MRMITEVLNRAVSDFGYVIAGPARRVYRRVDKDHMKQVPAWELNAVLQLIDGGQLSVGGTHLLRCGAVRRSANSVLVSKSTRSMLSRWNALKPFEKSSGSKSKKGA